ncbi:MAG: serine hydrolase domain-containing protein, partial [Verrucomicrobiota bacterium]
MARFFISVFAGWTITTIVGAAELPIAKEAQDFHEEKMTANEAVVFGRIEGEKTSFGAAGLLGKGRPAADEHTLFEIGSITKPFTCILLADLVLEGRVALNDSIAPVLTKAGVEVGEAIEEITFLELATHRSGFPRLPSNLKPRSDQDNPYAHYSRELLEEYLIGFEASDFEKRGQQNYSNLGMGLRGYLIEELSGQTYEER